MSKKLLTAKDVAEQLQIKEKTLIAWKKEGRINSFKLGGKFVRFTQKDVDDFIEKLRAG